MTAISDTTLGKFAEHKKLIDAAFAQTDFKADQASLELRSAVSEAFAALDQGVLRVVTRDQATGVFAVNEWLKKAILLNIRLQGLSIMDAGQFNYIDKIPVKTWTGKEGVRVVPPAIARRGSFIESGAILMPSYVNMGAYVSSGTMVDTWATVGSCAFIGRDVHLSGGVGIGGVLEPVQARPVIIEDHVFVGSRCILVEGVHVEEGAVIGAGVTITASTKIIDVSGSAPVMHQGRVPKNSVVIPGSMPKQFPAGQYGVSCALIIGKRTESTDRKTSLNSALRDIES